MKSVSQRSDREIALQGVIAALERHDCAPKQAGAQWSARCPAHADQVSSLSIGQGKRGDVLLHCFAACETEAIVAALGLTQADLFVRPPRRAVSETRYEVRDASGGLVAIHVRRAGAMGGRKSFDWRRPDGAPGLGGMPSKRLPLYGSEHVQSWPPSDPIVVVEGEKAADALRDAGFRALGTVTGASVCPSTEALGVVIGRPVTLWPDFDGPGRLHMARVARELLDLGVEVHVFTWAGAKEHEDAFDYFARGLTAAQLRSDLLSAKLGRDWLHEVDSDASSKVRVTQAPALDAGGSRAVVTLLADVESKDVEWLWKDRIPLGMLTILDGDPGLGKSTITLDVAARLSHGGMMPDGSPGPGVAGTVILTAEDDLARVVRPRLGAAGGDLNRIATVSVRDGDGEREPIITPDDLAFVEEAISRVGAKLVIVDPLMAYLPPEVNANHDQDVRRALALLRDLAERTGAAVVVVRHLNKARGGPALYRGGGSIGIIGAARSGLLLAADPAAPEGGRVLAVMKSNLAPKPPSLRLQLVQEQGHDFPVVKWEGACDLSAAQLLAAAEKPERRSARTQAMAFLRATLAQGSVPAKEVERLAEEAGISSETLRRARRDLGVTSEKVGRPLQEGQQWLWSLRRGDLNEDEAAGEVFTRDRDPLRASDDDSGLGTDVAPKEVSSANDPLHEEDDEPLPAPAPMAKEVTPAIDPLRVAHGVDLADQATAPKEVMSVTDLLQPDVGDDRPAAANLPEGGQTGMDDRLLVHEAADEPERATQTCPDCGGRTLRWSSATVCTRCHRRFSGDEPCGPGGGEPIVIAQGRGASERING